jgi:hypothetical protein
MYEFEPSQLVGGPLAAAVDEFGHWRHQLGEDDSLLALLAAQALEEAQGEGLGAGGKATAGGCAWRVGVHLPVKSDADIEQHAAAMAEGNKGSKVGAWLLCARNLQCMQLPYTDAISICTPA